MKLVIDSSATTATAKEVLKRRDDQLKEQMNEARRKRFEQKRKAELDAIQGKVEDAIQDAVTDEEHSTEILDAALGEVYRYCQTHSCPCGLGVNGCAKALSCGLHVCDFAKDVTGMKGEVGDAKYNVESIAGDIEITQFKIDKNRKTVLDELESKLALSKEQMVAAKRALMEATARRDKLDKHYNFTREK